MPIVDIFGEYVDKLCGTNARQARWLLKTGWEAQNLKYKLFPDRRLIPADRFLAGLMMDTMLKPLKDPEKSAIISVFTPCEMLQEVGLNPYNAESFS